MKITYDSEADAMSIYLRNDKPQRTRSQVIHSPTNPRVIIDFDADDNPISIELLYVSDYVTDPTKADVIDLVQRAIMAGNR
jgi:uncharacterized protein YuzE